MDTSQIILLAETPFCSSPSRALLTPLFLFLFYFCISLFIVSEPPWPPAQSVKCSRGSPTRQLPPPGNAEELEALDALTIWTLPKVTAGRRREKISIKRFWIPSPSILHRVWTQISFPVLNKRKAFYFFSCLCWRDKLIRAMLMEEQPGNDCLPVLSSLSVRRYIALY